MSNQYIVSHDTSLGADVVDMREEAAEYFAHNPYADRVAFVMLDEHDLRDDSIISSMVFNETYVFINKTKENNNE